MSELQQMGLSDSLRTLRKFQNKTLVCNQLFSGNLWGDCILSEHSHMFMIAEGPLGAGVPLLKGGVQEDPLTDLSNYFGLDITIFLGLCGQLPDPWTALTTNRHAISRCHWFWLDAGFYAYPKSRRSDCAQATQWENIKHWDNMKPSDKKNLVYMTRLFLTNT